MRRGRVGLIFIITGFLFLLYGSSAIIEVPSEDKEQEILHARLAAKKKEKKET